MATELAEHGYTINPATLHPALGRMEDGRLRSTSKLVDGRTRSVYSVTPAGRRAMRDATRLLAELADEALDR